MEMMVHKYPLGACSYPYLVSLRGYFLYHKIFFLDKG